MGFIWEEDDEFTRELLHRQDMQSMRNEESDGQVIRTSFKLGFAVLLFFPLSLLMPAGIAILWLPLSIWIAFRLGSWVELYRFRRQMASEFSSESPLMSRRTWPGN